jgi:hypothetical protein
VSPPKKNAPAGESQIQKRSRKKKKLIKLDDLIPKGDVSGGHRRIFGATDADQTPDKTGGQRP